MADCRNYREMISCYADGELSGNDKIKLQRHLDECASCRSLLSLYTSINEAASESLKEPPDSFTDSVMGKIRALPEVNMKTTNKPRRPLKPYIISIVAAAACLALAFIVSPGLFNLTGKSNSTVSMPMASAAPAANDMAIQDAQIYGDASDAELKSDVRTESTAGESGALGGVPPGTSEDDNSATQAPMTAMASPVPSPLPSTAPQYTVTWKNSVDELTIYYAIIMIEGQLPDGVEEKNKQENSDGTFSVEVSVEVANQLVEEGFAAEMGAPESDIALIKYVPLP